MNNITAAAMYPYISLLLNEAERREAEDALFDKEARARGYVPDRTCRFEVKDNMNETEGCGDVWFECSTCACAFDYYADQWLMRMNFCPNCGARVKEEA